MTLTPAVDSEVFSNENCPLCGRAIKPVKADKIKLTELQIWALQAVATYIHVHRMGPTVREIAGSMRALNHSTGQYYLKVLKKKGLIARTQGKIRSVRITPRGYDILKQIARKEY